MFQNFTSKPFWHQCWAIAVAVASLYFLVRVVMGSVGALEYGLSVFVFGSLLINRFFFAKSHSNFG